MDNFTPLADLLVASPAISGTVESSPAVVDTPSISSMSWLLKVRDGVFAFESSDLICGSSSSATAPGKGGMYSGIKSGFIPGIHLPEFDFPICPLEPLSSSVRSMAMSSSVPSGYA